MFLKLKCKTPILLLIIFLALSGCKQRPKTCITTSSTDSLNKKPYFIGLLLWKKHDLESTSVIKNKYRYGCPVHITVSEHEKNEIYKDYFKMHVFSVSGSYKCFEQMMSHSLTRENNSRGNNEQLQDASDDTTLENDPFANIFIPYIQDNQTKYLKLFLHQFSLINPQFRQYRQALLSPVDQSDQTKRYQTVNSLFGKKRYAFEDISYKNIDDSIKASCHYFTQSSTSNLNNKTAAKSCINWHRVFRLNVVQFSKPEDNVDAILDLAQTGTIEIDQINNPQAINTLNLFQQYSLDGLTKRTSADGVLIYDFARQKTNVGLAFSQLLNLAFEHASSEFSDSTSTVDTTTPTTQPTTQQQNNDPNSQTTNSEIPESEVTPQSPETLIQPTSNTNEIEIVESSKSLLSFVTMNNEIGYKQYPFLYNKSIKGQTPCIYSAPIPPTDFSSTISQCSVDGLFFANPLSSDATPVISDSTPTNTITTSQNQYLTKPVCSLSIGGSCNADSIENSFPKSSLLLLGGILMGTMDYYQGSSNALNFQISIASSTLMNLHSSIHINNIFLDEITTLTLLQTFKDNNSSTPADLNPGDTPPVTENPIVDNPPDTPSTSIATSENPPTNTHTPPDNTPTTPTTDNPDTPTSKPTPTPTPTPLPVTVVPDPVSDPDPDPNPQQLTREQVLQMLAEQSASDRQAWLNEVRALIPTTPTPTPTPTPEENGCPTP